ncbi:zinc-binding dehydrogenase [Frigoribacterium sp. UYMn621]|uniref:zinc-binding dehydrogenase n=1 Tax=Frigoribacterium sp. UYMn621 TaxID=3156343 RepID=UPI0033994496
MRVRETMRAIRIHGAEDVRLETVDRPCATPGSVLIRNAFAGICGTDLHLFFAPESFGSDFHQPAPLTGATWPQILGHEFSGTVAEVGAGVRSVAVGDNVAVFPYNWCGKCQPCLAGQTTGCELMAFEGIQGRSGGMAEFSSVAAEQCFVLPRSVDLTLGALVEPMAVAWHSVAVAQLESSECVLVVGGGPIGLGACYAARARGIEMVIFSEPSRSRRELLHTLGVAHVIDPTSEDLPERVRSLTRGRGVDAVIDAAGSTAAFPDAMRCLAVNGRMVVVAVYEKPYQLTRNQLSAGRTIRNSEVYSPDDYRDVIEAMSDGLYDSAMSWIDIVELEHVEEAIRELGAGRGMKTLVRSSR